MEVKHPMSNGTKVVKKANKNNVDTSKNNLFVLAGQEEEITPYDMDGMPAFEQERWDMEYDRVVVKFRNEEDRKKFAKLVEQNLTDKTISIWYPMLGPSDASLSRWVDEDYEE